MDFTAVVLIVSAIIFIFLFSIWSVEGLLNIFLKILFVTMVIATVVAALHQLGWVIQIPG